MSRPITAGDVIGFTEKDGRVTLSDGDFQRLLESVRDTATPSWTEAITRVQEAGSAVAKARTDEALQFLRFRTTAKSDGQAKAQAIVETSSQLDIALAEWEAARAYLAVAVAEAAREGIPNVAAQS